MKKLALYMSFIVTGLLMAACNEDFKDWAAQKTYLPEDAITIPGYSASAASETGIDLNAIEGDDVQLINLSGNALPEGYLLSSVRAYITPADDENAEPVILKATDAHGVFSKDELQEVVLKFYNPRPTPRTFKAHIYADAIKDGQGTLIDAGEITLNLTPIAPHIAENYYLIGGPNDWYQSAVNKTLKFSHSDKDVYEDPVFTVVFPASEGDTWFAFGDDEACEAIGNNDWNKLFGTKGESTDLSGSFDFRYNLGGEHSFCVAAGSGKFIKLQINMMTYEYQVTPLNYQEFIYVPGNGQKYNTHAEGMPEWGWTPGLAAALQSPNFDGVYTGYVYLDGGFKFTKERDWDHGEYNWTDFSDVPACINNGEGTDTNLYCDTPGLYFLKVDIGLGKIEATLIEYMGITGDYCGWNEGVQMTWNAADVCYELTGAAVNANGWKFRANGLTDPNWTINLGSNDTVEPSTIINDLVGGGKNIGVVGTTIKLYPCRTTSNKIYCTVE